MAARRNELEITFTRMTRVYLYIDTRSYQKKGCCDDRLYVQYYTYKPRVIMISMSKDLLHAKTIAVHGTHGISNSVRLENFWSVVAHFFSSSIFPVTGLLRSLLKTFSRRFPNGR